MGGRIVGLDVLRGIAALCVVVYHALEAASPVVPGFLDLLKQINLGRFGVLLFFLISGYVIPASIARHGLREFAIGRAFRLLPALWGSVLLFSLIWIVEGRALNAAQLVANMAMLARAVGYEELHGVYWTLTYELFFYCACASAYALRLLDKLPVIAVLAVAFALAGPLLYGDMVGIISYFLTGMLAYHVVGRGAHAGWLVAAILANALAALIYSRFMADGVLWSSQAILTAYLLPFPLFLLAVRSQLEKVSSALLYLGTISYSVYLYQGVALWLFQPLLGSTASAWLYPAAITLATVILAAGVYRAIERPGMAMHRQLLLRRVQTSTAIA